MVETVRTQSALLTNHADNTAGDISAEDARDAIVSGWTPGWVRALDHRLSGETSHSDDLFFADGTPGTPAGGTAVTPTGTVTWLEGRNLLSAVADGQSSFDVCPRLYSLTPTSPPVTIISRTRFLTTTHTNPMSGICFTDGTSTSSNVSGISLAAQNTSNKGIFFRHAGTLTSAGATQVTPDAAVSPATSIYQMLVWSATNTFKWAVSLDGVLFTTLNDGGGASWSHTMTPTHFGPHISSWTRSDKLVASWDMVLVAEADLSP